MIGRRTLLLLACLVAVVAGLAAGSLAVGSSDDPPAADGADDRARSETVEVDASAPDPAGGPAWAVRIFTTQSGRACVDAGRYDGAAFGRLSSDGRIESQPADRQGVCGAPGAQPGQGAVLRFAAVPSQPERTVVFGRVSEGVVAARLLRAGEAAAALPLGRRGTFIAVLDGLVDPRSLAVELSERDGSTSALDWR